MSGAAADDISSQIGVLGFFHVGVTVRDMDESLRFYRDGLGLTVVSDGARPGEAVEPVVGVRPTALRSVFLSIPHSDALLELFEYLGIERRQSTLQPSDIGFSHFCLLMTDVRAVHKRALALGYTSIRPPFVVVAGPHSGATAVYLLDPNGYAVELFEPAPGR